MARVEIENIKLAEQKREKIGATGGDTAEICKRAVEVNKLQNFWTGLAVCAGFACNAVFWVWCLIFAGAPTLHTAFWVGALIGFLAEAALFAWSLVCGIKKRNAVLPIAAFAVAGALLLAYEICLAVYLGQMLNFLLTVIFCVVSAVTVVFIGRLVKNKTFTDGGKTFFAKLRIILLGLFTVIFCVLATFCAVFIGSGTAGNGNFKLTRNARYGYDEELGGYCLESVYYTLGDALNVSFGAPLVLEENVTKNFKTAPLVGIKDGAFNGITSVKSVNLPASVVYAGAHTFEKSEVKEIVVNSDKFDFNGCLDGAKVENVSITNPECAIYNAFSAGSAAKFTVPKESADKFRNNYPEYAASFAPEVSDGELYINFNDGTRPLEGWNTLIVDKQDLKQVDGGYEVTASFPDGFSIIRETDGRRQRLVSMSYGEDSGEFLTDNAKSVTFKTDKSLNAYCEWSEIYNIEYLDADGYFDKEAAQKSYFDNKNGTSDKITLPAAHKEGYTFYGWYLQDGDNRIYADGTPLKDTDGRDYSLHAEFLENYDIQLDLRGGTVAGAPAYYHEKSEITLPSPTMEGFTFLNWSAEGSSVSAPHIPYGTRGDITFSAEWKLNAPTVTAINYSGIYDGQSHTAGVSATHVLAGAGFRFSWDNGSAANNFSVKNVADTTQKVCTVKAVYGEYISDAVNVSVTAQVTPKTVTAVWSGSGFVYNNAVHTVTATADGVVSGETLTLALSGNTATDAGSYTARAEMDNGNYRLEGHTYGYSVARADYNMSGVTFDNGSHIYDGQAHSLAVTGDLPTGLDGKQVTVSYSGSATNVADGAQTVTASFDTTSENYNKPQDMTATITITPANYDMSGVSFANGTHIYDGDPHSLAVTGDLPKGLDGVQVTVSYSGSATNVAEGAQTVTASFATTSENYNKPQDMTATITITPANYDMGGVKFENGTHIYDGDPHSLTVTGDLPKGLDGVQVTVSYSGSATNVADGAQTVTASFATTSQNYNTPADMTATITITPATISAEITAYSGAYADGTSLIVSKTVTTVGGCGYKILYGTSESGEYSETEPVMGGDILEYTVWYKITAENHSELTGSINVSVTAPTAGDGQETEENTSGEEENV